MKQRKASSGLLTIGSPRTLKLVLTMTGQPVFCLNWPIRSWKRGLVSWCTVCTRAERARDELHAALEPAERLAVGQCLGRFGHDLFVGQHFEHRTGGVQPALDFVVGELRTEVAAAHAIHRAIQLARLLRMQVVGD